MGIKSKKKNFDTSFLSDNEANYETGDINVGGFGFPTSCRECLFSE